MPAGQHLATDSSLERDAQPARGLPAGGDNLLPDEPGNRANNQDSGGAGANTVSGFIEPLFYGGFLLALPGARQPDGLCRVLHQPETVIQRGFAGLMAALPALGLPLPGHHLPGHDARCLADWLIPIAKHQPVLIPDDILTSMLLVKHQNKL